MSAMLRKLETMPRGTLGKGFARVAGLAAGFIAADAVLIAEVIAGVAIATAGVIISPTAYFLGASVGFAGAIAVGAKVGLTTYRSLTNAFNRLSVNKTSAQPLPEEGLYVTFERGGNDGEIGISPEAMKVLKRAAAEQGVNLNAKKHRFHY